MINKSKKVIAVLLCLIILLPSLKGVVPFLVSLFPSMPNIVYADDYVEQDRDKESQTTYYMVSNSKQFKDLFDFDISDVVGPQLFDWVFNFKTYTIIAKSHKTGDYTMYFNTPNLQSIVKNEVIGNVADGYTDDTYDINETEWIVPVGTDIPENEENIITKYGFDIPNYTYMGEYPKEIMSVAGIVPTKWYSILWNFIKGLLGFSFLDAPDASNFNTITYLNHKYGDTNYWVLDFFKKYYIKYFVKAIPENEINGKDYFKNPDDFNEKFVSHEAYETADAWKKSNQYKYNFALACSNLWNGIKNTTAVNISIGDTTVTIPTVNPIYDMLANESTYNPRNSDPDYNLGAGSDANSFQEVLPQKLDKSDPYKIAVNNYRNSQKVKNVFGELADDASETYYKDFTTQQLMYEALSDPIIYYIPPHEEEESTESSESTETSTENTSDSHESEQEMRYHEWSDGTDRSDYTITGIGIQYGYNSAVRMSVEDYANLCSGMSFINTFPFEEPTILSAEDKALIDQWNEHTDTINRYKVFEEMFDRGDAVSYLAVHGAKIPYKQCLIASDSSKDCYSTKHGDQKVSLSVGYVYAQAGLYKEIDLSKHSNGEELTTAEAQKVIRRLQTICGPYYSEVLQNMVILMTMVGMSLQDTGPMELAEANSKDARVMPYDVATLVPADKVNYNVRDPRVELYKSHFIGALISNFEIKLGFGIWFKPQTTLIEWGGKITEISVKFQQLICFDWLEEAGLSPADMWTTALPTTMMVFLAIFFIAKTVIALFKMGTKASGKLIIGFIFFFLELGIITAIALKPKETWDKLKNINNFIMTFGEKCSPPANNEKTAYLFDGNNEAEILFYLPYIDMWSKYNTGYNLQDDEQYFDIEDYFNNPSKYPELKEIEIEEGSRETKLPKLKGTTDVKHYSIVLADAFSYYGYSASVTDSIGVSHETDPNIPEGVSKTVNGPIINNNAYRVVDHFMSPRVTINEKDEKTINFTITENENFNDEFQSGIVDMITKLFCCCLGCFLSLLKFITFLWFWWVLYIFIFRVMLGKVAEHKKWGHILAETFGPLLMIVFIGLYAGIVFNVVMDINGLIGLIFIIVVFGITFRLIPVWQRTANGLFFPLLLKPLADFITTVTRRREYKNNNGDHHNAFTDADQQTVRDRMANDIIDESIRLGDGFNAIPDAQETFSNLIAFTKQIFDEKTYNMKYENCHRIYIRWYQLYKFEEGINSPDIHDPFVEECYRQYHSNIEEWIKNAKQIDPNDSNRVRIDGHEIDLKFDDLDIGSKTSKSKSKSKLTNQQGKTNKINQKTRKRIDKIELKYKKKHNKK